jgi:hypothetical protein
MSILASNFSIEAVKMDILKTKSRASAIDQHAMAFGHPPPGKDETQS